MVARSRAWLAAVAVAGGVAAAVAVFGLRFDKGDVYPAYSSLQAGPSGSGIVYDALRSDPQRRLSRLDRFDPDASAVLPQAGASALLRLGERPFGPLDTEAGQRALLAYVRQGGRLVVAYGAPWDGSRAEDEDQDQDVSPEAGVSPTAQAQGASATAASLSKTCGCQAKPGTWDSWLPGLRLRYGEPKARWAQRQGPDALPRRLPIRGGLALVLAPGAWTPWYRAQGNVVAAQRSLGRGSIIAFADAYPFSNEAQRMQPAGRLLAACLERRDQVIFDERGLGLWRSPDLAELAWRFGLGPLLGLLAGLAALWLWRSLAPLLPPRDAAVDEAPVSGSSQLAGLLRGQAGPAELLERLVAEWEAGPGRLAAPAKAEALRREAKDWKARKIPPAEAYRRMQASLTRRKDDAPRH
jgi:hypothetical protein